MPLYNFLAFVIDSLLIHNKLVLIDHKYISIVSRCSRSLGRLWGCYIFSWGLVLDDGLNLKLCFNWLRHLLLTIHVEGVGRQIQCSFVFFDNVFLKMWSHLNCTTGSYVVGYFFNLFRAILGKALKEELLLILWPCNFNLLRSPPGCKKSYYVILMSWVLLDLRKISCLHTILSTTINWLWKLQVWLTPAIILLLCWVIFSNNIFSRLFIINNKS